VRLGQDYYKMKTQFLIFTFFLQSFSFSQTSQIIFNNLTPFNNGIYISYQEVLENSPRFPNCKLRNYFKSDSSSITPFAYIEDGAMFINFTNKFYKIIIKGPLSIFYHVTNYDYYYFSTLSFKISFSEDHIFFIDFQNGRINNLNIKNLSEVLSRDTLLFNDFSKLSNRKKKKSLLPYILKFNGRNPIYLNQN
jgi:hypothetical protein